MFLPLFVLALLRAPAGARRPALGWAVLAVGLAAELLLVGGGLTRAARPALAVAALGMAWIQGRPGLRATALLLWFVPIPSEVVSWPSPALETNWGEAAAWLVQRTGSSALFEVVHDQPTVQVAGGSLRLLPHDGGLHLAALLSGLVWYAGLRRAAPVAGTIAVGLACAGLAVPIQIVAVAVAAGVTDAGGPARFVLDAAPWLAVVAGGLPLARRAGRSAPEGAVEPLSSRGE